ncbi:MAG: cobalamin-binding protein [Candidatus Hydrogenedentota bacterium]
MPEQRIISLIASATEIVCALGCEDKLVGISHECDYPESVNRLPRCTEAKFQVEGLSCEINERLLSIVKDGLSVYRVFPEHLDTLKPDVIVTQSHCDVCAVSLNDVEEALKELVTSKPRVVSLEPSTLSDIWASIKQVAEALEVPEAGQQLTQEFRGRMDAIADRASTLTAKPKVACIEWIDPLMTAGNWMPELVSMAGGKDLFGIAGKHSPWLEWQDFVNAEPDVVLVFPCGWDRNKARTELVALEEKPEWAELDAVKNKQVYLIDGNQYCNRPGPRLVETLEILAEIFHPEQFNFGHQDIGWSVY